MAKKEKEEIERIVYAPEMFQKRLLFIVLLIARFDKRRFSQFKKLPLPINLLNLQVICWRKGIQRADVKLHLRHLQSIGLVVELRREDGVPFYGVNEVAYMRYLWQFAERHYYQTLEAVFDDIYNDTFLETTDTLWDCDFPINPNPNIKRPMPDGKVIEG